MFLDVIRHRTVESIADTKSTTLLNHVDVLIWKCKHDGCRVTQITTDPEFESALKSMDRDPAHAGVDVACVARLRRVDDCWLVIKQGIDSTRQSARGREAPIES